MSKEDIVILHDQHMHSEFSQDSNEDLRSYFEEAKKQNIKYVMTCEHFDFHTAIDGTTWSCDYDKLILKQKKLIREFKSITPLLGIELGYRADCLDEMHEIVNKYDFDLIQLSIHDNGKFDYYFENAFSEGIKISLIKYYDLMLEGITTFPNFDVLSHIDFAFKTALMIDNKIVISDYEDNIRKVFKELIKKQKTLEVNSKVLEVVNNIYLKTNPDYKYDDHLRYLLRLYKDCGGAKLSLSSDAHNISKYRLDFNKHLQVIKEMGFNEVLYFIKRKEYRFTI